MQAEHAPVVDLVSDRCERWIGRHNPLALFGLSVTQWCAVDDLYVVRFALPGGLALDQLGVDGQLEEEDQEPDVKTTFAQFGLAYYQASVLEHEIVNILAVTRLVATRRDAEQLLSDPWDYSFKATMGPLVKQLEKHLPTDNELGTDLIEALRLRNHLAHAFWRERADDFCTDAGRMRMIAYLIETRKFFQSVDRRLTASVGTAALQQWGVTPDVVDAWYRDILERVERGELDVPLTTIESAHQSLLARITQATS